MSNLWNTIVLRADVVNQENTKTSDPSTLTRRGPLMNVAKHLPRVVRFFDAPGPNPWVARLALMSKGVGVDEITRRLTLVDGVPENRSEEMLKKNPAGTTP